MINHLVNKFPRSGTSLLTKLGLMLVIATFAGSTFLIGATPADAVPRSVRKACKHDYKRLCPRYRIGSARMRSCMRNSVGGMSPRCYNRLVEFYGGKRKFRGKRRRRR